MTEQLYYEHQESTQSRLRRYSQSFAASIMSAKDSFTRPHYRNRSFSTSSVDPASLAVHLISSVNNDLKEEYTQIDDNGICEVSKALLLGAQRLLFIDELPKDRRENQYILSGYRFYRSTNDCLKSLFKLHNETLNIWSHLLGFIFFGFLSVHLFQRKFPEASAHDLMIFTAFCIASLACLLCSSIYHTFICHSAHTVKSFTATLDYIGITFLITASISTIVHFGFYCDPISRNYYMVFSSLIGSIGVILPFFRFFDTKRYRPLRIGLFVAMAFSSIVPLLHLATVKGLADSFEFLKPALMGIAMYVCGVTIYANRFPEKFFPGRFDSMGMTSHAIWHFFVCLGIFFHYLGSFHFYNQRESFGCKIN
ncbi:hemolysin-III related-domain-containing protein [Sporodiniella umbellata]|nr:hemolysin-III related-domain-containing protein [Sporodiniella umbellata]